MRPQKIRPFLWYTSQAEEAAKFYVSLFKDSKINSTVPGPHGTVLVVDFQLAGTQYLALNGGPHYQLTAAFSLSVDCDDQAEIDELWDKLSAGGQVECGGWLKDQFGLSWQIVPAVLPKLMSDPNRAGHVMQSLMQMTKLNIAQLQAAYDNAPGS